LSELEVGLHWTGRWQVSSDGHRLTDELMTSHLSLSYPYSSIYTDYTHIHYTRKYKQTHRCLYSLSLLLRGTSVIASDNFIINANTIKQFHFMFHKKKRQKRRSVLNYRVAQKNGATLLYSF